MRGGHYHFIVYSRGGVCRGKRDQVRTVQGWHAFHWKMHPVGPDYGTQFHQQHEVQPSGTESLTTQTGRVPQEESKEASSLVFTYFSPHQPPPNQAGSTKWALQSTAIF